MSELCPTSHSSCTPCVTDNRCVWSTGGIERQHNDCYNRDYLLNHYGVSPPSRNFYFSVTDCNNAGLGDKSIFAGMSSDMAAGIQAAAIIAGIIMLSIYTFNFLWLVCPPFRRRAVWICDPCLRCMWFTCCCFFPPLGCLFLCCFERPSSPGRFSTRRIEPPPGILVVTANPVNTVRSDSIIVTSTPKTPT